MVTLDLADTLTVSAGDRLTVVSDLPGGGAVDPSRTGQSGVPGPDGRRPHRVGATHQAHPPRSRAWAGARPTPPPSCAGPAVPIPPWPRGSAPTSRSACVGAGPWSGASARRWRNCRSSPAASCWRCCPSAWTPPPSTGRGTDSPATERRARPPGGRAATTWSRRRSWWSPGWARGADGCTRSPGCGRSWPAADRPGSWRGRRRSWGSPGGAPSGWAMRRPCWSRCAPRPRSSRSEVTGGEVQ